MKIATSLVSIIIPMYNAEKYIEETIQSVLNQSYGNWELIVVDDCSSDKSVSIVKSFILNDNRIQIIESDVNFGGPARPRNIGIEKAEGKYIAFLDSDDLWIPEKLEKQLEFMERNNLNFSDTNYVEIDELSSIVTLNDTLRYKLFHKRAKNICRLIGANFLTLSSVMIKKNFIEKFSENSNHIAVEDYRLWLELFSKKD